jgi:predicted ATPase
MITRLEVDGFKSLREFAVDLEPLTVFVGPNGAGKTNLLEALGLLGRLASMSVDEAFKKGRGKAIDQFSRHGGEAGRTIRFAVEVSLGEAPEGLPGRYRYEITIERRERVSGLEELAVADECLRVSGEGGEVIGSKVLRPHGEDRWGRWASSALAVLASSEAILRDLTKETAWRPMVAIAEELSLFRLLQLDATRLREASDRIGSGELAPDASNLPTVLADLPGPVLGEIRADLVSLVPGIADFDIVPEGESLRIDFKLSGGDRLPARLASDGTLRALALLTALQVEPRPSILGIEEPENGIYPGRLRKLLSLLPELTAGATQLLLTTHSPIVVAAFRDRPELLRFVDLVYRDGMRATRARKVGKPHKATDGAFIASLREVDALLHAADSEAAE